MYTEPVDGGTVCIGNQLIGGHSMYREPVDWGAQYV